MIKRTGEHVLTWIGVGIGALIVLFVALMVPLMQSDDFMIGMQESDANLTYEELTEVASGMQVMGTFILVGNVIAVILAIIGGIFISKKAKTAAILLLIAGVVSLLCNWPSAILWIIASIMLFSRKPKSTSLTQDGYYNYDKANEFAQDRADQRTREEDPYKY
ncbi:DUF4064 domain-containing protein [Staphylococcus simulans]